MRSAFIGIVGRPNVGKSTLLNAILGEKIAITTNKPQTTRNTIRGIYNEPGLQLIFIDTPGIHKAHHKLGEVMTAAALKTLQEVDLILFLVDGRPDKGPGDKAILEALQEVSAPKLLLINKVDVMEPADFKYTFDFYERTGVFAGVYGLSALRGNHVEEALSAIKSFAPEGPMYFPPDMITDHPERFLVSEIIREKLLLYLQEEVPHGTAVEIERYTEGENLTEIDAVIICEKKSHKGIIIGKGGKKLKGIGKSARLEIEALVGTKVFLQLWVKVKENWRDSGAALSRLGYTEDGE